MEKTNAVNNPKKLIGIIVGVIVASVSYWAIQKIIFSPPSFDKVMMQAASELNKTCPIMVNQFTRFDNAIALPENVFQYNYTLIDLTKEEVNIDTVKKYIEPGVISNSINNPDLKLFRDNKATLVYVYKDKNGVLVHKISVTPNMYSSN